MNEIEERIKTLGLELPPPPPSGGIYHPVLITGNQLYVSGQGPVQSDGQLIKGKVGADLSLEEGQLAARQVAANHEQYFKNLKLAKPEPTQTVELAGYVAFADLCRHFDVDPETLKALNPALRPPVINGQKYVPQGYHLRLKAPAGRDALWAAIPETIYHSKQSPAVFTRSSAVIRPAASRGCTILNCPI